MASSTQLWAVSSDGVLHVLQDVGAWLSSVRSNEVLHAKTTRVHDNWTSRIDGNFDSVACGYSGLVCAKKNKVLYIRRGVTYDNPLGTTWTKALCDSQVLAVGSKCIVRLTSNDQLFVTDSLDLSSSGSIFLPHWNSVPPCREVETHQLFTLDAHDNLFMVSPSSGEVFMCQNLSSMSSENFAWKKLVGGPSIKQQSMFYKILGWDDNSSGGLISGISAGDGCVWCLATGGREVFQLVLNYEKKSTEGERNELVNIEGSWKRFELPGKDEATLLAADKMELDALCAVVQENKVVVSYALLQESSGRIKIPNPDSQTFRWKSVSVCAVPKPSTTPVLTGENSHSSIPKKTFPSIYPKLPPREDYDICCENGDCSFCRSATEEAQAISRLSSESSFSSSGEEDRLGDEKGREILVGIKTRRRGDDEAPGAKRVKFQLDTLSVEEEGEASNKTGKRRKRRREVMFSDNNLHSEDETGFLHSPKKPRVVNVHQLLIADIPFQLTSHFHQKVPNFADHKVYIHSSFIQYLAWLDFNASIAAAV